MSKSIAQYLEQMNQAGVNVHVGGEEPKNPTENDLWFDTVEKRLKVYKTTY